MLRKSVLIGVLLVASPSFAQQQPTPNEQALWTKLLQEIQQGVSCSISLISTQADLAKAQAKIKELEQKPDATAK